MTTNIIEPIITDLNDPAYQRELGDGLVLRWSNIDDIDRISDLYSYVFRPDPEIPASMRIPLWVRDIASGKHPSSGPGDFAIVEDTKQNIIPAALVVLHQKWRYEKLEFGFGRPESVASLPDYRNRGLIRAIFELFHARSSAYGELAQGITGIPYFYRQFGYEYAVDLGGSWNITFPNIPTLKEGEQEPYRLRPVTLADLPLIQQLYDRECHGVAGYEPALVSTPFDIDWWRWSLTDQNPESGAGMQAFIIQDQASTDLGYLMAGRHRSQAAFNIYGLMTLPGTPMPAMLPSILRGLMQIARETPPWREPAPEANTLQFHLGEAHPFYTTLPQGLVSSKQPPYGWYVRVPDLPAFIQHIAPVLERRLAGSLYSGYSGELKLQFYRSGLRMLFEQGRLSIAESWKQPIWKGEPSAGFPPLVFLQLLFGRRSLSDLKYAFPDVWAEDQATLLLETLFPKRRSWAIGQD